MTTKLITAGLILVAAIVFGFIFWNQFNSNQQDLAGNNVETSQVNQTNANSVPKNDNISSIETDLNTVDVNSVDSDSAGINTEFSGF